MFLIKQKIKHQIGIYNIYACTNWNTILTTINLRVSNLAELNL
jgi:hypothetical protein